MRRLLALVLACALALGVQAARAESWPYAAVREYVCQPGLRWDCDGWVMPTVWRESSGDVRAVNPYSGAQCWFQLMPEYHAWRAQGRSLLEPEGCLMAAYSLWLDEGEAPWR